MTMIKRNQRRALLAATAVVSLGSIVYAEGETSLRYQQMHLYGIEQTSGDLVRYDYNLDVLTTIGPVQDTSGATLTGIEASGYVEGYTNLYAFWTDPSDSHTKMLYINKDTAEASVVGGSLGRDLITGAVALDAGDNCEVYVVQVPVPVQFEISGGQVIPSDDFAVKISVLGAAISAGGSYDMPVTVKYRVGPDWYQPHGSYNMALTGNINDGSTHHYIFPTLFPAGSSILTKSKSWLKIYGEDGSSDSEWYSHMTVTSTTTSLTYTLRDGDDVPDITPFMDQETIVSFLDGYVDAESGKVTLDPHQAIYLFELGTSDPSSDASDFQDLVVLVSLAHDFDDFSDPPPVARLSRVDHETGDVTEIMDLSREYESLASTDGSVFYATAGNQLYKIDTASETETLVGPVSTDDIIALDFGGETAIGFDTHDDHLLAIDHATAAMVATPKFTGAQNLSTLVLVPVPVDPAADSESYD